MDERKTTIKELEEKKRLDTEFRNRLLEELGEVLLGSIGDGEPFEEKSGETPGAVLADYRKLRNEMAESAEMIKNFEAETARLKALEAKIAARESENTALEKELSGVYVQLGRALLLVPESGDFAGPVKQREEFLLAKIEERENKLESLDEKDGGIFSWLGRNAQMAVSRTFMLKDKTALEHLYRVTGEKYLLPADPAAAHDFSAIKEGSAREVEEIGEKARDLRNSLAAAAGEVTSLRAERRKIVELFGAEGSPARRIQALENRITHVRGQFKGIYLRFGGLAAGSGREAFSAVLREEDRPILEKAENLQVLIDEKNLAIEKIRAAISIDDEKAEIEKMKKAIANQHEKITAAEKAITDLENRIGESEHRIEELNAFLSGSEK